MKSKENNLKGKVGFAILKLYPANDMIRLYKNNIA